MANPQISRADVLAPKVKAGDFSLDFLLETKEVWELYYEKELMVEDARQIASNMIEFFSILNEWEEVTG